MKIIIYALFIVIPFFGTTINAQNVGIGTSSPVAKLDVNSPTSNFTARFNGDNQMYIGMFEQTNIRGYLGSFSGNAEDVDFGTATSNTNGKLHLTINANPKMTINTSGNVGVGTTTPTDKMDVVGNIALTGELKPNGVAGTNGQVLTSNGNGTMQWAAMSTPASTGNGGWGDCSINNIDSYQPIGNSGSNNGYFGSSVAISGNYAIVGAPNELVNGNVTCGSVTIFKLNSTTGIWENQVKLFDSTPDDYEGFGGAVAISDNYAIIGCQSDSTSGSVSIYKRNTSSGIWESQGKIFNPNQSSSDRFGNSVSISGDYVIVGAYLDDENGFSNNGSATIFKRNTSSGVWESQGKILDPSGKSDDTFGNAVSISGDFAIVGALNDDEFATDNGSASVFKRNTGTGTWEFQTRFIGPISNNAAFGSSVCINGNYVIIGTPKDDRLSKVDNGSALLLKRNSTTNMWDFVTTLINPSSADDDSFGSAVFMSPDYIMVGSNQDDENGESDNGSITIFKRVGELWHTHQKFTHPYSPTGSNFGNSVGLDSTNNYFLGGSYYFNQGSGAAFFGRIK